jgi:hypothetical protein
LQKKRIIEDGEEAGEEGGKKRKKKVIGPDGVEISKKKKKVNPDKK